MTTSNTGKVYTDKVLHDYHTAVSIPDDKPGLECLSWSNLSYTVKKRGKEKKLISDMYGSVRAGQVIAILGASGAGKSTLLNTLAGRIGPGTLGGEILIDGKPRNPSDWRLICSYVEQDDVMFPNFTVFETLMFAAMLRLPSSMSRAEKMRRVENVIADLGLNGCRDTPIGTPEKKGISGGERKRVSIGIELVADPNLIFLDEPTSGLDSFNALNVISQVRNLATKQRKLVLMTIHQPRNDILDMFDKIIFLSEGRPLWFGPIDDALHHFESLGYKLPPRTNPADFMSDIASVDNRSDELKAQSLERIQSFTAAYEQIRSVEKHGEPLPGKESSLESRFGWPSSFFGELSTLLRRYILELTRDRGVLVTAVGQVIFIVGLIGGTFGRLNLTQKGALQRVAISYILPLGQSVGNVMPYVASFPRNRMITKRERAAGTYRSASNFFAKFLSILPVTLVTTLIVTICMQFISGLNPNLSHFIVFFVIFLVHNITMNALALTISALSPSIRLGQILAPIIIFLFMFLSIDSLPDLFSGLSTIKWIAPNTFTSKAFLLNELDDTSRIFNLDRIGTKTGPQVLVDIVKYNGPSLVGNLFGNVALAIVYLLIGFLAFNKTSAPLLKLK